VASNKRITSVQFKHYKALKDYSVSLSHMNVLVGPNNSGKSTILGAFRILSEGIRRARARKPELFRFEGSSQWGYRITLSNLPISTENVFTDYDEDNPARILFRLSDGNALELVFPEIGSCYLMCKPKGKAVMTPASFRSTYPLSIGFVPILGPVEHHEILYKEEAARLALLTHSASRNFRNIWYHFPDDFDLFQNTIRATWPGMDIERPHVERVEERATLFMFCPEHRYAREIYWAGFGFQVWCQMLTYAIRARHDDLLIIDEPDIYLHSDLQRQLLAFLQELGPDTLIATHSTEIISEVDQGDILVVNKRAKSAKRLSGPTDLRAIFDRLGSNLNPILTQLAKTRRALFLEGKDFQILSAFARRVGQTELAQRSDFAVISVNGFNPDRVGDYSKGIEVTLGTSILRAVIFDRDYRSPGEVASIINRLMSNASFAHIFDRKEIENYLLEVGPLQRAVQARLQNRTGDGRRGAEFNENIAELLRTLSDPMKHDVAAQYQTRNVEFQKRLTPAVAIQTLTARAMEEFDNLWSDLATRLTLVPGKDLLSRLNGYLQEAYRTSITPRQIISQFQVADIPQEIRAVLDQLELFRRKSPG
jgi:energy-coupling factor transporter ATP-binding protein EcfA2